MARGQLSLAQLLQHLGAKAQQPQGVGNGRAGFSHLLGGVLLGQAVFLNQCLIAQCFFHRVQILPLKVFDQRQLHGFPVIRLNDHCRDITQVCQPGCPPAPFTGDDLIVTVGQLPDGQRLNHSVYRDGIGQ